MSDSPPQVQYYDRSPQNRENSSFSKWIRKPFHVEDSSELSGTYSTVTEIQGLCTDSWRLRGVEHMLQHFRLVLEYLLLLLLHFVQNMV